ncbi:hypothetical protein Q1695_000237 [Nippostrongylus brasiliensis]|nr:hypothetical protein Q1695_000237 [Nippostrongylus brasiliensis]
MQQVTYTIEPIPGREVIQRHYPDLPSKAEWYSNRHLTLNERFTIMERGYFITATYPKVFLFRPPHQCCRVIVIPNPNTGARLDALHEKFHKQQHVDGEKSKESAPCSTVSPRAEFSNIVDDNHPAAAFNCDEFEHYPTHTTGIMEV